MGKQRKPKVGDPVRVYGKMLEITNIGEHPQRPGMVLAKIIDIAAFAAREKAVEAFKKCRTRIVEESADLSPKAVKAIEAEMKEHEADAREALFTHNLRVDLLSWFEEKKCWVSNGRIMSDDEKNAYAQSLGLSRYQDLKNPPWSFEPSSGAGPDRERAALLYLESQGGS